ncbi:MAG: PocR ligand-binding domain-containing protein [Bacillota bacterium]|nr:PocR ligand-binding domain-containing protein [Bacillota bacterium]
MKTINNTPFQQNQDIIQPVLENLSNFYQLWIKYVSCSGTYVITPINKQQCNFCRLIRNHPVGYQRCRETARRCVYLDPNRHHLFPCHAGLYVLAVPLQGERGPIGALATGEIRISDGTVDTDKVLQKVADLGLNRERLSRYYEEVPVKKSEEILLLGETLYAISNCFIRLGSAQAKIKQAEIEKTLLESELRALSSQINPHFLFNALNTIQMFSYLEGARRTPDIINALSNLLRARLNVNNLLTSLKEELEVINNFLFIQRTRFEDRLQVVLDIPDDLLDARVPALSLQPLVENALTHGLEPYEGIGHLELQAEVQGQDLIFHVRDNGVGMTPGELAKITGRLNRKEISGEAGEIGIANIHKRCLVLFGERYGISIKSEKNRGTEVTLRIPFTIGADRRNENFTS